MIAQAQSGTGKTATPDDAQNAHAAIRGVLRMRYDGGVADATRIQYGGSVKPALIQLRADIWPMAVAYCFLA